MGSLSDPSKSTTHKHLAHRHAHMLSLSQLSTALITIIDCNNAHADVWRYPLLDIPFADALPTPCELCSEVTPRHAGD
jgi:hypothetical protein